MTSELWQRIRAARTASRLKQQDIARATGVSRVAVGHWEAEDEARRTHPSMDALKTISEMTSAPLEWLLSDDSDIHPDWAAGPSRHANEFVPVPVLEGDVIDLANCLREHPGEGASECVGRQDECELVGTVAISTEVAVKLGVSTNNRLFAIMIADDSMAPDVQNGDMVLIDPDHRIASGDMVAVRAMESPSGYAVRHLFVREYDPAAGEMTITLQPASNDFPAVEHSHIHLVANSIRQSILAGDNDIGLLGAVHSIRRSCL